MTEDHSVVQEKVRRGQLTPEQALTAPGKNVITRAVGIMPSVRVDTLAVVLQPGDAILMCSDGLTRHVRTEELTRALPHYSHTAVEQLVNLANIRGGKDNITTLLVSLTEPFDSAMPPPVGLAEKLRSFSMLESCTNQELKLMANLLMDSSVRAGKLIYRVSESSDHLYFLLEGQVALTHKGRHIATVTPGTIFGELGMLEQIPRTTTALATEPCSLLLLSRHRLEQIFRGKGAFAHEIGRTLVKSALNTMRQIHAANDDAN